MVITLITTLTYNINIGIKMYGCFKLKHEEADHTEAFDHRVLPRRGYLSTLVQKNAFWIATLELRKQRRRKRKKGKKKNKKKAFSGGWVRQKNLPSGKPQNSMWRCNAGWWSHQGAFEKHTWYSCLNLPSWELLFSQHHARRGTRSLFPHIFFASSRKLLRCNTITD